MLCLLVCVYHIHAWCPGHLGLESQEFVSLHVGADSQVRALEEQPSLQLQVSLLMWCLSLTHGWSHYIHLCRLLHILSFLGESITTYREMDLMLVIQVVTVFPEVSSKFPQTVCLKTLKCTHAQFWRPKVQNEVLSMATVFLKIPKEEHPCLFQFLVAT